MTTIPVKPSMLSKIIAGLVERSRRDGSTQRAGLAGGAQLVVEVRSGWITMTIKRQTVPVGARELDTFRKHARMPDDAQTLTPPEQGTREVAGDTWHYVTFRWEDTDAPV
jgi:hypothetical protein